MIYFRGCLTRDKIPQIEEATRYILDKAEIEYRILENEGCCGSVLLRTGFIDDAKQVMDELFEKIDGEPVIVSCAGCYHTLKKDFPEVLGKEVEVIHTSQLLDKLLSEGKISVEEDNRRVTYHDPCHLGRHMGEYETPRRVIKSKSKLIEMDRNRERSRCCGAGGGVRSANPDKSMAMAQQRVEDAIETGAELIISCCPFCRLNLDENGNMKVIDLTEFIGGKNETF